MTTQVSQSQPQPLEVIANYLRATSSQAQSSTLQQQPQDVISWGERSFYIPSEGAIPRLISFLPHQKTILRLFFDPRYATALGCSPNFQTIVYSTVKKSGKTALAALIARWITETWGSHCEVFSLANDLEQARGRIYAAAQTSIELDPRYQRADKGIANLWRIIERQASYIPTHSTLKAVSSDYKGEAGSNPTATFWSELWGYESEAAQRLWEELTPVPTRPRSIRYVETYAGYDGESTILNDLEDRIKKDGYRLTPRDLETLGFTHEDWPFPDKELPLYVHPPTRTFAYWDSGLAARRMPWQTHEYYTAQEGTLRPSAFRRLHLNERVSNDEEFIPREWWDRLTAPVPALSANTPVIVGADASVTGDCTALVAVSRDPQNATNLLVRAIKTWKPTPGHPLDYASTIKATLIDWCSRYNVVQIAYDQYQLHHLMTELRQEAIAWCKPFSQNAERSVADKQLYDLIKDARIHHDGDPELTEHIQNCAAKVPKDDNSRLRLIKKAQKSKIDAAVALSMACHEALRLNL